MSNSDHIDFYWRPGCGFCMNLERRLTDVGVPFRKLNIWESDDHAAFVRSVANGNETVPTLSIGAISLVNPSVGEVLDAMRQETPDLVPAAD
ncbi:MAG: glutaredoxin domain-containing protein [Actinomycetota bacterium]